MSTLTKLAWLNVIVHAAGLVLAVVGMRPGSPLVGLDERIGYLAGRPLGWSLGWGTWMLCALALIVYFAALARQLPADDVRARLAVLFAVAGGAVDLLCDVIHISVLPLIAARAGDATVFLAIERIALGGGMVVANGMYTAGTLLLTRALRDRSTPAITGLGYGVFVCGMLLVVAGFLDTPRLAEWATGPTIGLFCVWTVLVARRLS